MRRWIPCLALAGALLAPASLPADCPESPLDVAPGVLQGDGPPPTWLVEGDGAVDVSDVLALLRGVVQLHVVAW
ncbi:MAG: hypothetical protein ACYTGU_21215, partial [Planctomycetota bacterium]